MPDIKPICKLLGWRYGQFWFNFFEWLNKSKGYAREPWGTSYEPSYVGRMADPFYISDDHFIILLIEYRDELRRQHEIRTKGKDQKK